MKTYTNNEVNDPRGFKDQAKIKYEATKAIVERFPNGTATLMHLLSNSAPALDWDEYCVLPAEGRLEWETGADKLNQAMIAKKNLQLAYSQGNHTAYPTDIKAAAWYLSTQYPNNKPGNQQQKSR